MTQVIGLHLHVVSILCGLIGQSHDARIVTWHMASPEPSIFPLGLDNFAQKREPISTVSLCFTELVEF